MGKVSSISSGMTQSLPALRCLPSPLNQRTASSRKHRIFTAVVVCCVGAAVILNHVPPFPFRFCGSCVRTKERDEQENPRAFEPLESESTDSKALYALACFKGEQFRVGDGVYLPPDSFNFRLVT